MLLSKILYRLFHRVKGVNLAGQDTELNKFVENFGHGFLGM
jgi:hypothetical protein